MAASTANAHVSCALDKADVGDLVQLVKAEYLEMPGLCLTLAQAQRLWSLDRATCVGVLGQLVKSGFLWRTEAGIYQRSGEICNSSPLKRSTNNSDRTERFATSNGLHQRGRR